MKKGSLYLLGALTLLMFPLGLLLAYFQDRNLWKETWTLPSYWIILGLVYGVVSAFIILFFSEKLKETDFIRRQSELLKNMQLTLVDCIFISLCAGFGEELLFRGALQYWFGPIITSIVFIAIHGYFSFKDLATNLFGLLLFAYILGISYLYEYLGLWFCVIAHATYDFVLLYAAKNATDQLFQSEVDLFYEYTGNWEQLEENQPPKDPSNAVYKDLPPSEPTDHAD